MRVCAITPHVPPDQAANAILPRQLGDALAAHDVTTRFVAHPPTTTPAVSADDVVYVPRRDRSRFARTRAGAMAAGLRIARGAVETIRWSDLVHLHGNGLIIEVGQFVAERYRKPCVLTLYGTDIWHHDAAQHARFGHVVRTARCRVFYSQGLLDFAKPLELAPDPSTVIYAPVPPSFHALDSESREALRRELGVGPAALLLTVKRLHDVAGYDVLLRALPRALRDHSGARVWIVGEGERRAALEAQAHDLGLAERVRFIGLRGNDTLWRLYAAADLFVLPSRLESWGTVMLESLACGTRVVATDTAGGVEVHAHFPDDVTLAPKENHHALASAIEAALLEAARVGPKTAERLRLDFSVTACAARYLDVYRSALSAI